MMKMMNKMKKTIVAALAALSLIVPNGVAFAANPVTVTLNGTPLRYTLIDPQIINDRVMVPIRETAEFLGMTVDWNAETGTMTFTKGNDVITHVLHRNTITVNGVSSTFDTPSQTIEDRTVMPVRMLAESIRSTVGWDEATTTVSITNTASQAAAITNIVTSTNTATMGTPITFIVTASAGTNRIQLSNATTGALLATAAPAGSGAFSIGFVPSANFSEMQLSFLPIAADGTAGQPKTFTLKGTGTSVADTNTADILDIELDDDSIRLNRSVEVTVTANAATEEVIIYDANNNVLGSRTTYLLDGGDRVFVLNITPKRTGTLTLRAEAEGRDGKIVKEEFKVSVSNATASGDLINDLDLSDDDVDYGDEIDVTMTTDETVERVWVEFGNDLLEEETTYSEHDGNEYIWKFSFDAEESGYYYFYAEDEDGKEEFERHAIVVDNNDDYVDDDYYGVDDVEIDDDRTYQAGEAPFLTIYTGLGAESVWVEYDGVPLGETSSYVDERDGQRIWELTIRVYDDGEYDIFSENDDGDSDVYYFDISVDED